MNRAATTGELTALIAAHAAEIAALKAENETLAQRVMHLEEQLRLKRLHRYAPRSEKLKERIFNEAEQAAAEAEETDDVETAPIADTGLADTEKPEPKKRGRQPLPDGLPREHVEHDLPEEQKVCSCCRLNSIQGRWSAVLKPQNRRQRQRQAIPRLPGHDAGTGTVWLFTLRDGSPRRRPQAVRHGRPRDLTTDGSRPY
jgi:hypothetical protein